MKAQRVALISGFLVLLSGLSVSATSPRPEQSQLSKGKFLVASRSLKDPRFQEAVILLVAYDQRGAVGLMINRPVKMFLSDIFPDNPTLGQNKSTVCFGGPVGLNGIMLLVQSQNPVEDSDLVFGDIYVSASAKLLDRIVKDPKAGERFRAYVGYAGWGAGQLDMEVGNGDWRVVKPDAGMIFKKEIDKIWLQLVGPEPGFHVWNRSHRTSKNYGDRLEWQASHHF